MPPSNADSSKEISEATRQFNYSIIIYLSVAMLWRLIALFLTELKAIHPFQESQDEAELKHKF